ncbi:hypothetical protein SAMN04488105_108251 [Salipiger thiooxidans]|uniref:Uncharacterized protein n=1 Tax=Salipiger thiooxidans TaxID=282683 RepID=A0A1G7GAM6_9RHOB|nr:hypothetical protein SAMN04488105_108251 [Salipiger thiooxidans]
MVPVRPRPSTSRLTISAETCSAISAAAAMAIHATASAMKPTSLLSRIPFPLPCAVSPCCDAPAMVSPEPMAATLASGVDAPGLAAPTAL